MLINILMVIAVIVVAFLIIAATRPADFRISRSTTIGAPPATVFAQVNDFHKWEAWNPWGKIDPAMRQTYEGPAAGKGASYAWAGNKAAGEGRMTITDSRSSDLILIKLEFFKPFAAINTTEFTFKPEGSQTTVKWTMTGKHNFMMKAMCLFMNMDRMIGGQFEKGLATIKSLVETAPGS
jgi:hypothetical protein